MQITIRNKLSEFAAKNKKWYNDPKSNTLTSELDSKITDTGHNIDVLAIACRYSTENECYENSMEYTDQFADYAIEHFDFETAYLKLLNGSGSKFTQLLPQNKRFKDKVRNEFKAQKLQAGAFLALTYPTVFVMALDEWKENATQDMYTNHGDATIAPKELIDAVQEAEAQGYESLYKEWLHGDYREMGLLRTAADKFHAEKVSYDTALDRLTFDYDEDGLYQFVESYTYDQDHEIKMTERLLKFCLIKAINEKAEANYRKESEEKAKRRKEWEETQAYKKKREAEANKEREAKLLAMTKEAK